MRLALSTILLATLLAPARPGRADNGATVVADCETAIRSSSAAGYGIRIVSGGFTPGMQAYVHELPSTNSKTKDAGFFAALNVKYGVKPMNNTVEMVIASAQQGSTFELMIKKAKTSGGEYTASLQASDVAGKKLAVQDMVCTVPGATTAPTCDPAKKPVACPGGGAVSCTNGQWACPPLPRK